MPICRFQTPKNEGGRAWLASCPHHIEHRDNPFPAENGSGAKRLPQFLSLVEAVT